MSCADLVLIRHSNVQSLALLADFFVPPLLIFLMTVFDWQHHLSSPIRSYILRLTISRFLIGIHTSGEVLIIRRSESMDFVPIGGMKEWDYIKV